jgi:hypothetical protein
MDLLELEQGVDPASHWYYQAKAQALLLALRRHGRHPEVVKDVGAGSGFFSTVLLDAYPTCRALCIDPHYTPEQLAAGSKRLRFIREDSAEAADLYLFMDVIEHVPDDQALLRQYVAAAPLGSLFFISVPAFEMLWSGHDDFLGHYRRYTLPHLERVTRQAGLTVLAGRYLYGATFPVVSCIRLAGRRRPRPAASDMREASPAVNRVLRRVLAWENRLPGNRVAGSTAVVVATKN